MSSLTRRGSVSLAALSLGAVLASCFAQQPVNKAAPKATERGAARRAETDDRRKAPADAVEAAQSVRKVPQERPEQRKSKHDQSDKFDAAQAQPVSPAFDDQPEKGRITGFDFYRDPLNAKKPVIETFEEREIARV